MEPKPLTKEQQDYFNNMLYGCTPTDEDIDVLRAAEEYWRLRAEMFEVLSGGD